MNSALNAVADIHKVDRRGKTQRGQKRTGEINNILPRVGYNGISGLMRGLATLPQGGSRSLQWSETGMEDPKRTPWRCTATCV